MTPYDQHMNRLHKTWCQFPAFDCSCDEPNPTERDFEVNLVISIRGHGLPSQHRHDIIARVNREMNLAFGGNLVQVTPVKIGEDYPSEVWVRAPEVVEEGMQRLYQEAALPEVQYTPLDSGT